MLNQKDILQTQDMIDKRHLDIRTITMGISLLDCCDPDLKTCCDKIYRKITRCAKDLVKVGEDIEKEFGIPIVNKRISVTPISIVAGSCETDSYVEIAKTLDAAAITCGVNFIGGFSALVQKGCTTGDWKLIHSIPEAIGADVAIMHLKQENDYLPDLNELKSLVTPETKMICINNPNNPTGALMSKELLGSIVEIARGVGAYILCDEVYRHLTQEDEWCESIVDLYEKGISVSSMSKVFSLAGLRMGWIATHDEAARKAFLSHRDYNLISCGMFDDAIASIALRHSDVMLKRNQRIVRENLAILDDWIKENPHFFYTKPKAGTTALVYYDFDIPSYEFCKRMYHETGAFVTPGDCFEQPHSMRVGYACDVSTLRDGLAAVTKFAATL